jgi:hypothetical protein
MKANIFPVLFLVLMLSQLVVSFSAQVQAASSIPHFEPYLETYDSQGRVRDEFVKGEQVGIRACLFILYEVKVADPDNLIVYHHVQLFGPFDSGLLEGLTTKIGAWKIAVTSLIFCWMHIRGEFTVIPIGPLGTLGMMSICLAAFGATSLFTKRRPKKH